MLNPTPAPATNPQYATQFSPPPPPHLASRSDGVSSCSLSSTDTSASVGQSRRLESAGRPPERSTGCRRDVKTSESAERGPLEWGGGGAYIKLVRCQTHRI